MEDDLSFLHIIMPMAIREEEEGSPNPNEFGEEEGGDKDEKSKFNNTVISS